MKPLLIAAALAATQLVGCANLMSIHRQSNITPSSDGAKASPGAELVLMDAKQRGVFSVKRGDHTVVCAEPSPDALQAVAATTSLSLQDAKNLLQASTGLSESAANIGLRTQSIQLLRDAMYRVCEGYAGHAIDDDEVTMLHRRYQSLMLGLLAIEQVTGAVTSGQVALFTQMSATAGAAASQVADALNSVNAAEATLATERGTQSKLKGELDDIQTDITAKSKEMAGLDPTSAAATDLKSQIRELEKQRNGKNAELITQVAKVESQKAQVDRLTQAYASASARVTAATTAMAKFSETPAKSGVGGDSPWASVGEAVKGIVKEVVDTGFSNDACLLVMAKASKLIDRDKSLMTGEQGGEEGKSKSATGKDLAAENLGPTQSTLAASQTSRSRLEEATTKMLNRMAEVCANRLDTKTQPPQVNPTASTQKTIR